MTLPAWHPAPIQKLGNGASVLQESVHFQHGLGNFVNILGMRMEIMKKSKPGCGRVSTA